MGCQSSWQKTEKSGEGDCDLLLVKSNPHVGNTDFKCVMMMSDHKPFSQPSYWYNFLYQGDAIHRFYAGVINIFVCIIHCVHKLIQSNIHSDRVTAEINICALLHDMWWKLQGCWEPPGPGCMTFNGWLMSFTSHQHNYVVNRQEAKTAMGCRWFMQRSKLMVQTSAMIQSEDETLNLKSFFSHGWRYAQIGNQ